MRAEKKTVRAECEACEATGLYVGMAERDGTAVVCSRCKGTGQAPVTYRAFSGRQPTPAAVRVVHVARGYALSPQSERCSGGLPIAEWAPGTPVPATEQLYCPYLYTNQEWCAFPVTRSISNCPRWGEKAACWERYHADPDAPKVTV